MLNRKDTVKKRRKSKFVDDLGRTNTMIMWEVKGEAASPKQKMSSADKRAAFKKSSTSLMIKSIDEQVADDKTE